MYSVIYYISMTNYTGPKLARENSISTAQNHSLVLKCHLGVIGRVPESVDLVREGPLPRVQLQHFDAPQDLSDDPHTLVLLPHLRNLHETNEWI